MTEQITPNNQEKHAGETGNTVSNDLDIPSWFLLEIYAATTQEFI